MKPSAQPPRTPSRLSESVHHQLNMYALAASAAGVGMLALAQPADAKIVYTRVHHVIETGHSYNLDLYNRKTADFTLNNYEAPTCGPSGTECFKVWQTPAGGNGAVGYWPYDSALKAGSRIGRGARFLFERASLALVTWGGFFGTRSFGPWKNVSNRYLGLKFQIKGTTHYGWARLNVRVSKKPPSITATLTGYAYETIPNKPIIAGRIKGPDVITLEPGSLGRLALGSGGLPAGRSGK